jgi:hypothetical protein
MTTRIRPATYDDAVHLAPLVRAMDMLEIQQLTGSTPLEALLLGVEKSDTCFIVEHDGQRVAMFGVVTTSILPRVATIWMLGTDALDKLTIQFLKTSREILRIFLETYQRVENYVIPDNSVVMRFLEWLGFSFSPILYTGKGVSMHHFWKEQP